MKIKTIFSLLVAVALASQWVGCASEKEEQNKLAAQAKVSRTEAEKIALAKAPGGTVKEGELEKEKGRLIWSFDIGTPGTKDITEVAVDASTGAVVSVDKESAADEAREKKAEKAKGEDDEKEEKK